MVKPILIQGGTFDPVHNGHLRTALDVAQLLGIEQIRLLPCGDPPHRPAPGASAVQRLRMLQRAIEDEPRFIIDQRELWRPGPSYMVDTAESLRAEFGQHIPICLMMGMDAFLGLSGWHQWQRLPGLLNLVITCRPGSHDSQQKLSPALQALLVQCQVESVAELLGAPCGRLLFMDVTQLDISATRIRAMIKSGHSPRYLLPESVLQVIESERLYRNEAG